MMAPGSTRPDGVAGLDPSEGERLDDELGDGYRPVEAPAPVCLRFFAINNATR